MQQKYPFLLELIGRFKSKSPALFSKLQTVLYTLAGVFEFCTLLKDIAGVNFPDLFEQYINHGSALVVFIMAGIASLPVESKEELHEKIPGNNKPQ